MGMSAHYELTPLTTAPTGGHADKDVVGTDYSYGPDPNLMAVAYEIVELERPRRELNERRHSRIQAKNRKAQLIHDGRPDVVEVLNISRGGMRVASYDLYRPGTILTACSNYLPGGNNI